MVFTILFSFLEHCDRCRALLHSVNDKKRLISYNWQNANVKNKARKPVPRRIFCVRARDAHPPEFFLQIFSFSVCVPGMRIPPIQF